jgi:ABC-type Zn2+ transport system substrate-binding protein/surface adhesin
VEPYPRFTGFDGPKARQRYVVVFVTCRALTTKNDPNHSHSHHHSHDHNDDDHDDDHANGADGRRWTDYRPESGAPTLWLAGACSLGLGLEPR